MARLREGAKTLGEDIWITVKPPGGFARDDDFDDGTVIRRWTAVILNPDELGGLREALAIDAGQPDDEDECSG